MTFSDENYYFGHTSKKNGRSMKSMHPEMTALLFHCLM